MGGDFSPRADRAFIARVRALCVGHARAHADRRASALRAVRQPQSATSGARRRRGRTARRCHAPSPKYAKPPSRPGADRALAPARRVFPRRNAIPQTRDHPPRAIRDCRRAECRLRTWPSSRRVRCEQNRDRRGPPSNTLNACRQKRDVLLRCRCATGGLAMFWFALICRREICVLCICECWFSWDLNVWDFCIQNCPLISVPSYAVFA